MCDKRNIITDENYLKEYPYSIRTDLTKYIPKIPFKNLVTFLNAFMVSFIMFSNGLANPQGGQVVAGNATIQQTPNKTVINQTTNKSIINWHSFNIAPNESTHFQQPSPSSIALNRIDPGQGASQIFGRLTANGHIILVNQSGIHFGLGASVDVGGIIASTSDITDANFLAGKYIFNQPSPYGGSIVNRGRIIVSQNGLAALIGTNVSNEGIIEAHLGRVALASGNKFTVDLSGDQLIHFVTVDEAATQDGVSPVDGSKLKNAITNSGVIVANGGTILLKAKSASRVLDNVINMQGVAIANSVSVSKGVIILDGGNGPVKFSGKIMASGKKQGESGGTVKILGSHVALVDNAKIDVSGEIGGGQVLVGGNAHGAGPEQNANYTYFGPHVIINANALTKGNGGKVIVWSDLGTGFYGNIYAKGGTLGGNGGFVETSGKAYLDAMGSVDASATLGLRGQWLLDPFNVTITTTTTNGAFDNGSPNIYTPVANTATANVATINASLNGGTDVTITTGSSGTQAGNITLNSAILKSIGLTTATLTLNAAGTITLNNTISATSGGLNVTLIGDALTLNSAVTTNGGNFLSTTQNATTLANAINTDAGTVSINVNQDGAGANAFAMNAGSSITTTNTGASAVAINVNTPVGGTGTAALRNITTGSGGTLAANTGSSATGGSITMSAGTLNVGTGTISLTTSQTTGRAIGTAGLAIQMIAGNLMSTTGSGGAFICNSGTSALNLDINTGTSGLTLTSLNSSAITNSGTLTLPGLTITAGATQDITLNSAANNFDTVTITSGRNVSLTDTDAIVLGASTVSGTLDVTAGGTISQSGIVSVAGTPTFTVTTPLSDILLATDANTFSTTPVFTNNSNIRDLALRQTAVGAATPLFPTDFRNLTLIFDNAGIVLPTMTLTGALSATANGAITQNGALAIADITTLAAGANDITLNNANNNFSTLTVTDGNNVVLRDLNALILGASTINGTLDVTTNGAITQSGGLTVADATTLAAGSANTITLNAADNNFSTIGITSGNNVSLRNANSLVLNTSTVNGALDVTTAGLISQAGILTVTGITTLAAGADDIIFNNASNDFGTITITSGNNVLLSDINALILGASTINGTLDVTTNGALTQSGGLTVADATTLAAGSANTITLDAADNHFSSVGITSGNNVSLRNANSLVLNTSTVNGTFDVTTEGLISQAGVLSVSGATTLAAGSANNITLNNAGNNFNRVDITTGNNVSLVDTNAIVLGASTVSGTLDVTAGGTISQSGILTVAGTPTFTVTTPLSDILLATAANTFSTTPVFTNNSNIRDLALRQTAVSAITPTLPTNLRNLTLIFDNAGIVLPTMTLTGALSATANGAITQSGVLAITGITTLAAGSANNITLNNAGNNFTGVNITTGHDVTLADMNALIVGTSTVSGDYSVTAGGTISQTGVLTIAGTPRFTLTSPSSDLLLATSANVFTVTPIITNNGNVRDFALRNTFASAGVPILPTNLRNLTLTFDNSAMTLPTASITGGFTGSALGNLTVGSHFTTAANSNVTVTAGTFAIADGATFTTNNTNFNVTATDLNLNASGALNLGTGALTITQNTTNGSIGLGNTTGTMSISGSELQRMTAANFNLSAATDGHIIVDGILAANSSTISMMNFFANNGQMSSMVFQNNPSSFKAITASINNGITIGSGASLTTTAGSMTLDGDADGIGGSTHSILLNANLTSASTMTLSAFSNGIVINAPVTLSANGITINHAVNGANDLIVNAGTGTTTFASTVGATTPLASLSVTNATDTLISQTIKTTGDIRMTSGGNITLNTGNLTSSAGRVLLTGTGITLNSMINANAVGNSIIIAGQTFINNAGASALNPGSGKFLVWSGNPANDNRGGLSYNFKQYNAIYGLTSVAGIGNGFLYTVAPVIKPALIGAVTKPYNGTTAAILKRSNYTFSGVIDSDTLILTQPIHGTYASPNVGENIKVSVSGITVRSATDENATVYGYQIIPIASANIGKITPIEFQPVPIVSFAKSLIVDVVQSSQFNTVANNNVIWPSQMHSIVHNIEPILLIVNPDLFAKTHIENVIIEGVKLNNASTLLRLPSHGFRKPQNRF